MTDLCWQQRFEHKWLQQLVQFQVFSLYSYDGFAFSFSLFFNHRINITEFSAASLRFRLLSRGRLSIPECQHYHQRRYANPGCVSVWRENSSHRVLSLCALFCSFVWVFITEWLFSYLFLYSHMWQALSSTTTQCSHYHPIACANNPLMLFWHNERAAVGHIM